MSGNEFEKKWLKTFAPHLTQNQCDDCFIEEYLWHVFSYELVSSNDVLSGDAAIKAYNAIDKDDAITIQLWDTTGETQTAPITEKYRQSKKVIETPELYIVGKDWTWTFVSTHENGWLGPYFYSVKNG